MKTPRLILILAVALTALPLALTAAAPAKVKKNPENNSRLGPDDNPGYFLGHPTPTYQWHGCTKTATFTNPRNDFPDPSQAAGPGTAQKAVTFTYNAAAAPFIRWQVKKGYKICGVQASVTLSNPDVDSDLLGQAGYTSGKLKGSTSTAALGKESIKVKIKKGGVGGGFEEFEGRTYSINRINAIAVFVKKK